MLDGEIQTTATDAEAVNITWKPNTDADGISLLELFLSDDPTDTTVLFNLGMAYSDQEEWNRAIEVLRKLIEKEP